MTAPDWTSLATTLRGQLARPGEDGYAAAEPWNLSRSVRPAAVVSVADPGDVATTVRWAAGNGLRVAVQRTGHSALDHGDDVVLVQTSGLATLEVDPGTRTATVGAGVLAADLLAAGAAHGLLPVGGAAGTVGVVGLLTGGGIGPMVRTLGVGSDRVRRLEVVTGDGELRIASANENPDLFWGLRGGKATLGIVTSVEIELVERTTFFGGGVYFAADDIPALLRAWAQWAPRLPSEATTSVIIGQLPDRPGVPEPLAGVMTLGVRFVWLGAEDEGRRLVDELLAVATPVLGEFATRRVAELPQVHNDPTTPVPFHEYGSLLADFPVEAADAFAHTAGPGSGSPLVMAEIRQLGGQAGVTPDGGDAVTGRSAGFNLAMGGVPVPDPQPVAAAGERVLAALAPWQTGQCLANFVITDDPDGVRRYWDDATFERLCELGDRYDPRHVLHVGQVARTPRV